MKLSLNHISAITLFVDDLQAAKSFYQEVFGVEIVFEDESSVAVKFENLIINLLRIENAQEIVEPEVVATRETASRFQLSIWVEDVDAVCMELQRHGVKLLSGPRDRPWGMRTANFIDTAGHSWEVGQRIDSK